MELRRIAGRTVIERAGFLAAVIGVPWFLIAAARYAHYSEFLRLLWGVSLEALFIEEYFYGGGEWMVVAARLALFGLLARFGVEPLLRWLRSGTSQ